MLELDLTAEALEPLGPVTFPDGSRCAAVPYDAAAFAMHRRAESLSLDNDEEREERKRLFEHLLARSIPDATPEQLETLSSTGGIKILYHCRRQLDLLFAAIEKNGGAGPILAAPRTQPSAPPIPKATASRASRRRSAATGSSATASPIT